MKSANIRGDTHDPRRPAQPPPCIERVFAQQPRSTTSAHRRSLNIVAGRAGQHNWLFHRLKNGRGCNVATLQKTYAWFDANWPFDLEWPADVPRPSAAKRRVA